MNRAERRRVGAKNDEKTITFKYSDYVMSVYQELEKARKQVTKETVEQLMCALVIALHKKFGFGKDRIHKFIDEVNYQFSCIESGHVSLKDMSEWCQEYGIKTKIKEA